jgi:hypothetical protein
MVCTKIIIREKYLHDCPAQPNMVKSGWASWVVWSLPKLALPDIYNFKISPEPFIFDYLSSPL